jgi:CRP-like cAMP-binding protein
LIRDTVLNRNAQAREAENGLRSPVPANRLFSTLSPDEYMQLAAIARSHVYPEGEVLTRQSESVTGVHFVRQGRARAELSNHNGEAPLAVINFLGPGSDIGLISIVDGAPHSATVRAMEEVRTTEVPLEFMQSLLARHPEWYVIFTEVAIARLRTSGAWLERLL